MLELTQSELSSNGELKMVYGTLSLTVGDASNEKGTTTVYVDPAIENADVATLRAAILALSTGTYQEQRLTVVTPNSNAFPTGTQEREEKILIRYEDTTTLNIYTFTIPCFDKAGSTRITGTDFYEITSGELATLVTQLEANALSPAGNAINVLSAQYVGRNS